MWILLWIQRCPSGKSSHICDGGGVICCSLGRPQRKQRYILRMLLALKERRDTKLVIYVSPEALDGKELSGAVIVLSQKGIIELLLRRGSSRDGAPPKKLTNACFEGSSVNTFCAANRLSLPPPCCGNAATLPLRGPWMYVVGYSPGVLGPSTYSTALCSSLRPYLDLFARGSRSECFALCLSLSA